MSRTQTVSAFGLLVFAAVLQFQHIDCLRTADGGAVAKIYAGKYFQGKERELFLQDNQCLPLFSDWTIQVQSIKFDEDTCVQLYDQPNCDGNSKILQGRYKTDRDLGRNLANTNFNRKVQSVHLC